MSNFIIAIAVFLITVIGALFAVPYFIDWNGYRGVFEEEATRVLGREVRVGGAVNLNLLPTPYFRFEKVRIADVQDAFFRADSVTIKLSIPPLLRGAIEANEIELQRPTLRLALDDKDGWNWQSFGRALGEASYLPSNVALSSVRVTEGALTVHAPNGAERTRFDGLNGEFSAPSLDGPYRFRGTFGKARDQRELRIATARPEGDGSVRFKATLRRSADFASTYTLDGRLADIAGKPRIEGELTARLPIRGLWQTPAQAPAPARRQGGATDDETGADLAEAAFDAKANVSITPAGATFSDLALSFEQNGRPQLITGDLKAHWRDAFAVEMKLSSRWLDLDRIAGVGEDASPLDSIVPLAIGMRDLLPGDARSRASFSVDQANVGREAVSGLRLSLARSQDRLEIEELRLGMPGGSRGDLQGVVSGPSHAPAFEGSVSLRGSSLVRFLGWATGNAVSFDARSDGGFGLRSQISISPGRIDARNLVGDLSGTAIHGAGRYRWEGRPELSLAIDSPQLDARALVPAGSSLADIAQLVLQVPAAAATGTAKSAWRGQTDAVVHINAGQLITAARTYRDVVLDAEFKGGRLSLPVLKAAGDEGFSLELEGDVADAATRPRGSLRGVAFADSQQGVTALAELLGLPETLRPGAARAQSMLPLRLAGSVSLGARLETSADLVLDGEANGANVNLNVRLDGSAGGWRAGAADLTAVVESADAGAVAALLAPARTKPIVAGTPLPGRLLVKATGVPADGLAVLASADAGDMALNFQGRIVAAASGNSASGDLEIRAANAGRVAALAGLAPPLRLDGVPIAGTLKLSVDGSTTTFDRVGLAIGEGNVTGQLSLSTAGDRRRVEARLDVEELSIVKLLTPLLDARLAAAGAAEAALGGAQSVWPDEPFHATALDGFEGSIRLDSKRLVLVDGIGLTRASIDIALAGGRVEVRRIDGAGLGGSCSASLRIEKVPAGVEISGGLRVTGGKLEALAADPANASSASGTFSGEIKFAGKGTSPRSVLSVLQGSGTLRLSGGKLPTLWPGAINVAADAALQAEPDNLAKVLRQALGAALSAGQLPLPATVGVEIVDGRLGAKPFTIDTAAGRASGAASLDLKSLAVESEWRLEPKPAGPAEKPALPAAIVTYRGPVAALGRMEPHINTEALERELSVRRMERDVEELERLRKLDETRRREEAERQRRQFEQAPPVVPVPVAPGFRQPRPAAPG